MRRRLFITPAARWRHDARRLYGSSGPGPENYYVSVAADMTDDEKMIEQATFVDINSSMQRKLHLESKGEISNDDLPTTGGPHRSTSPPSCLSVEERRSLSDMIYRTHFKSEVRNGTEGVKAMMYQSALEVKFIEDAVEEEFRRAPSERDANVVRQRIKTAVIERCDLHKPLSYIVGYQPFYGCHISCAPPILCPRPETEMWSHWLVNTGLHKATKPFYVLDMCSGTGCIGIAIAKNAAQAHVIAVDVLPEAVTMSNHNAERNRIPSSRYRCVQSDMFGIFEKQENGDDGLNDAGAVAVAPQSVDVVVSNPPYILPDQYKELPRAVTHWESIVALVGDTHRRDRQYSYFQDLCEKGATFLRPASEREECMRGAPSLVIEVGLQAELVAGIIERHPAWMDVALHTDFAGQPRWVTARRR